MGIVFFLLGALGLWWAKAAFGDALFLMFAMFLYTNFLLRAVYHLTSGDIGAFLIQDLPRIGVWMIVQLFQRANFWQYFGISAAAISAGTPVFWVNLAASVSFFLIFTVAPLLTPPVGVCEWIDPTPPPTTAPPPTTYQGGGGGGIIRRE